MLTAKQEKFVRNLINGMSQREAYRDAFNNQTGSDKTIDECACKMFKNPKINTRFKELQAELNEHAILTAAQRMELLTQIATGEAKEKDKVVTPSGKVVDVEKESNLTTRMKALDILNKMSGDYIQKIQADVNADVEINIELTDADE